MVLGKMPLVKVGKAEHRVFADVLHVSKSPSVRRRIMSLGVLYYTSVYIDFLKP